MRTPELLRKNPEVCIGRAELVSSGGPQITYIVCNFHALTCECGYGVVVITFALHAKDPQFDPGYPYPYIFPICLFDQFISQLCLNEILRQPAVLDITMGSVSVGPSNH